MKQQTTTFFASCVLALALIGTAIAGPFEDGQVANRRQDYVEALRLWGQLADQGNARAQFSLGQMYYMGQGVPRDYAQADAWYRKAADQGFDYAQFNLGAAYEDGGLGVPQDYALAHMWFNLASSSATNTDLRQMAVQNRDQVAAKMTPAQIAEARRMAREWKAKLPPSCPTSMLAGAHCDASNVRRGPMSADIANASNAVAKP